MWVLKDIDIYLRYTFIENIIFLRKWSLVKYTYIYRVIQNKPLSFKGRIFGRILRRFFLWQKFGKGLDFEI